MKFSKIIIVLFIPSALIFFGVLFISENHAFYKLYEEKRFSSLLPTYKQLTQLRSEFDLKKALISRGTINQNNTINLKLSYQDLIAFREHYHASLNTSGYLMDDQNQWRKAKANLHGLGDIKVKLKIHGTSLTPVRQSIGYLNNILYLFKKRLLNINEYKYEFLEIANGGYAFKIKLRDDKVFNGKSRINLLAPHDDWTIVGNSLNKYISSLGVISTYGEYNNVKVNGNDIGLYLAIENIGKNLLERNFSITNFAILKNYDFWDKAWNMAHISPTMFTSFDIEQSGELLTQKIALFQLRNLFNSIENNDFDNLKTIIDINNLSKIFALSLLTGEHHPLTGDNTRYIYDLAKGTFNLSYRIEGGPKLIETKITEDTGVISFKDYDPHPLFYLLLKEEEFLDLVYKHLLEISDQSRLILDMLKKEAELYNAVANDSMFYMNIFQRNKYIDDFIVIDSNLKNIKSILLNTLNIKIEPKTLIPREIKEDYVKLFLTVRSDSNGIHTLDFLNDSLASVELFSIRSCDSKDYHFEKPILVSGADYNSETGLISNNNFHSSEIPFDCVASVKAINNKSDTKIENQNIHINYMFEFDKHESSGLDQFGEQLDEIYTNGILDSYIVKAGQYRIGSDVIFPQGKAVTFEPGVELELDENVSVLIRGDFKADGRKNNKIKIRKSGVNNFGTFAIKGSHTKPSDVLINNVILSGGNESIIDGTYFSSQLSIHMANVIFKNSVISDSSSDDGLNIKNANALIENNIFENNFADQVDLDFVNGEVINNIFNFNVEYTDQLTDGLDVSGSVLKIALNEMNNMTDKGLSVGEKSIILITNNHMKNNTIGSAIKDSSIVCFHRNFFEKNKTNVSIYIKKNMYQMPSVYSNESQLLATHIDEDKCDEKSFLDQRSFK